MLDRAMKMLEIPRISSGDFKADTGYYIKECDGTLPPYVASDSYLLRDYWIDPMYFPGRAATIYYRAPSSKKGALADIKQEVQAALHINKDLAIGALGILHPTVLEKFDIGYPCSALEFNLEPFKKEMQRIWTNAELE